MKKVAILTINDLTNFGNRLQNYAVQEYIKKFDCKVETISNIKDIYNGNYYRIIRRKIANLYKAISRKKKYIRYAKFLQFEKNINKSSYMIDSTHIPSELKDKYDFFITGSDQVWNPSWGTMSDINFLTFADYDKRISFSASMGISEIPEELKTYYKERVNNIKYVSVRENKAKELLEDLTGRKDIEVLLDPTMLLNNEDWDKVAKKPKLLKKIKNEKYIVNYFLGELSEKRKKEIERVARENKCDIIDILHSRIGPSEFLYLEKHAFLICTDSFHSSTFAILNKVPLIVFDREDNQNKMNSRLETLLDKFKLQDRKFEDKIEQRQLKCNYNEAYEILESERRKADNFIKKALEVRA